VLGVDEHIWRPSKIGDPQRAVTGMVDLTRDEHGNLRARLLDVVPGRSGTAYASWLKDQPTEFIDGVKQASTAKADGSTPTVRNRPAASLARALSQEITPTLPVASTQRWNRLMAHRMAERGSDSALSKAR